MNEYDGNSIFTVYWQVDAENDNEVTVAMKPLFYIETSLTPAEITQLRAKLADFEKPVKPEIGMPFTFARKLADGSVVTHYDGSETFPLTEADLDALGPFHPIHYKGPYEPDPPDRWPGDHWNVNDARKDNIVAFPNPNKKDDIPF